jgi:hypothetical protein
VTIGQVSLRCAPSPVAETTALPALGRRRGPILRTSVSSRGDDTSVHFGTDEVPDIAPPAALPVFAICCRRVRTPTRATPLTPASAPDWLICPKTSQAGQPAIRTEMGGESPQRGLVPAVTHSGQAAFGRDLVRPTQRSVRMSCNFGWKLQGRSWSLTRAETKRPKPYRTKKRGLTRTHICRMWPHERFSLQVADVEIRRSDNLGHWPPAPAPLSYPETVSLEDRSVRHHIWRMWQSVRWKVAHSTTENWLP